MTFPGLPDNRVKEAEETPHVSAPEARQRIREAMGRIGVGFADAAQIVDFDPEAETAYWERNRSSGKERIMVGPRVAALPFPQLMLVLRHEILHRSVFNGFGERFTNHELANLALDVCINRLLFHAFPLDMLALSRALYPEESKTTAIALADASANPHRLPSEKLRRLWGSIWRSDPGTALSLNPASIYYQLLDIVGPGSLPDFYVRQIHAPTAFPDPILSRAATAAWRGLLERVPPAARLRQELTSFSVMPTREGGDPVADFVARIRVKRILDPLADAILADSRASARLDPYPGMPTRLGLVYRALGVSQAMHLFWNRDREDRSMRLALAIYVDVSGSMVEHFPLVTGLVHRLEGIPLRIRAFDTRVYDIDLSAFVDGEVQGGGGTDFDAPVRDLLEARDVEAGVLLTDGFAELSHGLGRALRAQRKRLYVVLLRDPSSGTGPLPSSLAQVATETFELPAGNP